jgi:diacylglycerol O-acyltransferase
VESLSAADRSSLAAEQGPVSMAVGGLMVADAGPGTTYEAVLERVGQRIHLVPRFRQIARAGLLGFAPEAWADDRHFDLRWHVRRVALPGDAGPAELDAFVGQEMSRRLDRDRPLWELSVIEGLAGDRVGLLAKLHHAVADGMAAIAASVLLLDPGPEPLDIPPPDADWSPQRYDAGRHLLAMASGPVSRATKMGLEGAARARDSSPTGAVRDARRATELVTELARTRPQAPMTPLNEPLGPSRAFRSLSGDLAALKAAGKAAGGTVNDAVLAAVAGMLRSYLEQAGTDLGGKRPVALVPISLRPREQDAELGNRISTVFVDLPVEIDDPGERIAAVAEITRAVKDSAAVRAGALLAGAAGITPPLLAGTVARAMGSVRACNLVVSNLPGPQQPFYVSGQQLRGLFPVIPLNPANQRLSVGILSYDGAVCFGLLADSGLNPGIDVAAGALATALAQHSARR